MSTVYDLNWDDQVTNAFNIITTIVMMQVDDYTNSGNVMVNGIYVVSIALISHQWKIDEVVCTRTQFPLTLAFAITVHKYQGLILHKVVLSFYCKDDFNGQSYIALSCVCFINHMTFEFGFSYDCFFSQSSIDAKEKIADTSNRKN